MLFAVAVQPGLDELRSLRGICQRPYAPAESRAEAAGGKRAAVTGGRRERNRFRDLVPQQSVCIALRLVTQGRKDPVVRGAQCCHRGGDACVLSQEMFEHGEHLVHTWVLWAFAVGIGAGFAIYLNGYAFVNVLMKIPGARLFHTWLYRRMYFDELYMAVFVAIIMGLAKLGAWFDRTFVDGLVNFAAYFVKRTSDFAGLHDKYVVDGAVNGVAHATRSLGSAVRAPQSGRIRMYVTVLLGAIVIGIATVIVVVISR